MKILICEDNVMLHHIYQAFLAKEELTFCETGKSAITAAKKDNFDLLILDIGLPDGNGLDFACKLLDDQQLGLNIAVVTAHVLGDSELTEERLTAVKYHPNCRFLTLMQKQGANEKIIDLVNFIKENNLEGVEG